MASKLTDRSHDGSRHHDRHQIGIRRSQHLALHRGVINECIVRDQYVGKTEEAVEERLRAEFIQRGEWLPQIKVGNHRRGRHLKLGRPSKAAGHGDRDIDGVTG